MLQLKFCLRRSTWSVVLHKQARQNIWNTPVPQTQANLPQGNPQAKEVPKSTSPGKQDPENHIPKHTSRKIHPQAKKVSNPQGNIVNRTSPSIGSSYHTPSKPQANRMRIGKPNLDTSVQRRKVLCSLKRPFPHGA